MKQVISSNLYLTGNKNCFPILKSVLIILAFTLVNNVMAASRFAVASGDWSGSIWASTANGSVGATAPTSSDAVTINGNITVTVDNSSAVCASLSINPSNSNQ